MNVKCHTEHENRPSLYCSSSRATKSPILLMTNQNTTRPALHHQNQPPDSGSVHESQRRKLRLSMHRSHRHTCCVCFCLECFTISEERKGEVSTARPPATKSPFLLTTNQNTLSPAPHHQNQPPDFGLYMSRSSSSFGYRCIAVTAIHAVCVLEECFTIFRGEKRHN